ncbi:hypothetical protein NW767_014981 [Fusarium falciforme]|nr:hypothetical protein NW767_014981 [Fusarium falciforme]
MANPSGRPSGIKRGAFTATYGHTWKNDNPAANADPDADTIEVLGDASTWKTNAAAQGTRDTRGRGRGHRGGRERRGTSSKRKRAETVTNQEPDGPTCRGCLGFHD